MASIQQEPQGLDAFEEGLATFQHQEIQQIEEPTAAVESASLDTKHIRKSVTIVEPLTKAADGSEPESDIVSKLKSFYDENQTVVMSGVAIAIAYYFYKRNSK